MTSFLRTLVLFYKPNLRVQPLRELMAIAGVATGVALLFAVQVAHRSVTGSFEEIAHGLAGHATLELAARGPAGFDERTAEEVRQMQDVNLAAPILEEPIVVAGPKGRRALTLVGADQRVYQLKGKLSSAFLRAAAEAPPRGLLILTTSTANAIGVRPGDKVGIELGGRRTGLTLDTSVSNGLGRAAGSPIAAAPLSTVQTLSQATGRVSRVLIEPRSGRGAALLRELKARYGRTLNPRPVTTEAKLLEGAAGPEKQVTLLFSAISIVAGIVLAFSALLLASERRHRFIDTLIEIAAPEYMIVSSLVFDALVLGVLGGCLGLVVGDVISAIAFRSVPGYIAAAFAVGGQRIVGLQTILLTVASGLVAAFAAATIPALTILRSSATGEPGAIGRTLSYVRRWRLADSVVFGCGVILTSASVGLSLLAPTTTVVAIVGLVVGLVLCLPMGTRYLLKLARSGARRTSDATARLSIAELQTAPARSVALLATSAVAAFLMVLIGGSVGDVQHAARTGATDLFSNGALWIKPGGPENVYTTQPFAFEATRQSISRLGNVTSVRPWRDAFLDLPGRRVWVIGVPPELNAQIAPSQLVEGSPVAADRKLREGGWIAVSKTIARERHLHLGERITLPTPSGNRKLRLAAIIANYGWLPGAVVMNGNDQASLWGTRAASELSISLRPGTAIAPAERAVQRALPAGTALTVQSAANRRSEVGAVLGSTLSRLNDTTIVVLVATIVSVLTLMIAAIWQRRERLDSLTAMGLSSWDFARLVSYESGILLLSGCVVGAAFGLLGQFLIDGWLHDTTGASLQYTPAWALGLRTLLITVGICAAACMLVVAQTAAARRFEGYRWIDFATGFRGHKDD